MDRSEGVPEGARKLLAVREWVLDWDVGPVEVWVTGSAWWAGDYLDTQVVSVTDAAGEDLAPELRRLAWRRGRSYVGWDDWAHEALQSEHAAVEEMEQRLRDEARREAYVTACDLAGVRP